MTNSQTVEQAGGGRRVSVQVVGLGNPDRGDDGVGLLVAELVGNCLPSRIPVQKLTGDLLSLLDIWRSVDAVILVDATCSQGKPGTIRRIDAGKNPLPSRSFPTSSHAFDLDQVIELARSLGVMPEPLLVYGIEGSEFDLGVGMTHAVEAAAHLAAEQVAQEALSLEIGARMERS